MPPCQGPLSRLCISHVMGHIGPMGAVADRIRERLTALELTPRAASLRANRQPFTVRDILSGKNSNPKADLIVDLARALVCSTDYLLGLSGTPGAAPRDLGIDPRLFGALQRIPRAEQKTVRRMLEGVAEKSRHDFEADMPKAPRKKRRK